MPHIHSSRRGAVGTICIDRPARFNSLDVATAQDFRRAGLQMARDEDVRVVVLRGLPGMFCSGADLKFIRDGARRCRSRVPGSGRGPRRLRRALQADPRVHPQHHLGNPARPEAVHRGGGRRRRGGRFRHRDVVRSRAGVDTRELRVGVSEDRADRRGELDVPAAAPHRSAAVDGADAAESAAWSAAGAGLRARHRGPRRRDGSTTRSARWPTSSRPARARAFAIAKELLEPGRRGSIDSTRTSIVKSRSWRASPTAPNSRKGCRRSSTSAPPAFVDQELTTHGPGRR